MLCVLKRVFLLLLLLLAIGATAFNVLYLDRTPLPPAPPLARAIPSIAEAPGLSACWIATGRSFIHFSIGVTARSTLVRHPAGDLLVDTGKSSYFAEDFSIYPFWLRRKLQFLAGPLKQDVRLGLASPRRGRSPRSCAGRFFRMFISTTRAA